MSNELSTSTFTLGFSPCPNDTFIFDAMVNGKIDTESLEFNYIMADVEELNRRALAGELDITKLSFHTLAKLSSRYTLLESGSALGNGCGPLLIAKREYDIEEIDNLSIAIPGELTTANFLFSLAFPNTINKKQMVFSEIEEAVVTGEVDAGVIIHENRFTYKSKGLMQLMDLGAYWEKTFNMPIPLGGIAVKNKYPTDVIEKINRVIKKSVEFALANPSSSIDFVKSNSQEMDTQVIKEHINLYVNKYTIELGAEGHRAIDMLFNKAKELSEGQNIPT